MKAVAYLRVSTQDQSLERQYKDIKKFAKTKNLTIDKIFEDKISGSKKSLKVRIGFAKMEKYLDESLDIKNIIVLEISRLGRKNIELQNMIHNFTNKGINIHFKDLGISTLDDNGKSSFSTDLIVSILGLMAQNETRLLSERIKSGKSMSANKGFAFSNKITGYKKGIDGKPTIDEKESKIVKRIFDLSSKSMGARNISDMIKKEFNQDFAPGTINGIIRNSFYKGVRKYNELKIPVDPIVSDEVWKKANDYINSRQKKFTSRQYVNPNILQGIISCGICGNNMHQIVNRNARANQYRCKDLKCKNSINRPWLYEVIRFVVESFAKHTREAQVRDDIRLKIRLNEATIENNKRELKKLKNRKVKARELYLDDDDYTKAEYYQDISKVDKITQSLIEINDRLLKTISSYKSALESDIRHFSEDLEVFKSEIKDMIQSVIIEKNEAIIKLNGFRTYIATQPNGAKLGWLTKKIANGEDIKLYDGVQPRVITDEELQIMVDNHLSQLNNEEIT